MPQTGREDAQARGVARVGYEFPKIVCYVHSESASRRAPGGEPLES
jgi:hypothetical protein